MPDNASDRNSSERNTSNIARRHILKSLGAGTTVGLAGCSGGGGSSGSQDTSTDGQDGTSTVGSTATGGNGDWPDLSGKTLVNLSGADDALIEFYEMVNADFEEATGATVQMDYGGDRAIEQTLVQRLQAGNAPELFTSGTNTIYQLLNQDQLEPVTDVYSDWNDRWGEITNERYHVAQGGEEYLIPLDIHGALFSYREDIWGVGPNTSGSHPITWDEWLQNVREADGQEGMAGTYYGAGTQWCPQALCLQIGYSNGAELASWNDGNPQIVIDEYMDEWIETLNYVKDLHGFSPAAADAQCADYSPAYVGEVASSVPYSGGRPKAAVVEAEVPWAGDSRLMPPIEKERQVVCGRISGLITFQDADTELAKTYLRFLGTSERANEYLKAFYDTSFGHVLPPFPDLRDGVWQELAEEYRGGNAWDQSDFDTLTTVLSDYEWKFPSNNDALRQYHGRVWDSYGLAEAQHNVLISDADPEEALNQASQTMSEALAEAQE